jgi:hypothetical protein
MIKQSMEATTRFTIQFAITLIIVSVATLETLAADCGTTCSESDSSHDPPYCVSCWQKLQLSKLHPNENHHVRAGCPHFVACYAQPSVNRNYIGYYVGGGAVVYGEGRHSQEGVWGVDYHGMLFKRRVRLDWWHGRKYQGGIGAYKTDGPHFLKMLTE